MDAEVRTRLIVKETISKKQLRDFGILITFGFPLLIGWLLPLFAGHLFRIWTLWVGFIALIIAMIVPKVLYYPYKVWMAVGHILGLINSYIILGLVFIVVLQPIAYIMRPFGYDPLKRRRKELKTYRENRKDCKIDLTRIF